MDCIEHVGGFSGTGYGAKWFKGKTVGAHRLAYANSRGLDVLTMGGVVLHSCDNRACVNPAHLSLGTTQDNSDDCVQKGRSRRGALSATVKLTDLQVSEIRALYVRNCRCLGGNALAKKFSVTQATISLIVLGKHRSDNVNL